jgi:hypothetical protein
MDANTVAYTLMPEPNQTYLAQTKNVVVPSDPLSGSTVGLLMVLSSFQYQPSLMGPQYAGAVSQASQAAFIQSGGQRFQNNFTAVATKSGIDFAHSVGLTDAEMGAVGFTAKTVRSRQINIKGPKFYGIKSNLTLSPGIGNVGLSYGW